MNEHQRWMLKRLLGQVEFLEREIAAYDERLRELMRPFEAALERLDTIDGVGRRTAERCAGRTGAGYEAVSQRRRSDQLGRDVSGQPRECRQTPQGAEAGRKQVAQAGAGGSGLGRSQDQGQLPGGPVSATSCATRKETDRLSPSVGRFWWRPITF